MGNRISQRKRKFIFSRKNSIRSIRVVRGIDPAVLQINRNVAHNNDKIPDDVSASEQILPSPCAPFKQGKAHTGSHNLQNSNDNTDYLTLTEVKDKLQKSGHSLPKTDNNEAGITITETEKDAFASNNHSRPNENNDSISLNSDIGMYDKIHQRQYYFELNQDGMQPSLRMNCSENFSRGCHQRISQRTNSSNDSAITTGTCTSGQSCSTDYMCLVNCVCFQQHDIEYMVDVYKKRLQRDLRVEDILKELHCIGELQIEEIEKKSKESRQEAVDLLLGCLWYSSEPGKWQNFIEALESTGNTQIVKLLKNETENDSEKNRKILSLMSKHLVYSIPVDEFQDMLFEEELINDKDKEIIESEKRNYGPLAAAHKMFSIVPTKSENWELRLPEILRKCGLGEIAELMQFSEDHQKSSETRICKHGHDETDLKKAKCNHKRNHHEVHRHGHCIFRQESHYESIHNRSYGTSFPNNTDIVSHELRRQVKIIEEKVNKQSDALSGMSNLQNTTKDIARELENQRKQIQNLTQLHKQEYNDLRDSLNDIKSMILKLAEFVRPSPPEACQATVKNGMTDSGFSGGLISIPEDEMFHEFGNLHDDPEEYKTKL